DGREQPFFFMKSAHDLVPANANETISIHYPPMTGSYHWETELIAVIGSGGHKIPVEKANGPVWGAAIGRDRTRRDLQQVGKDQGRRWTVGKALEQPAPA